MGNSDVIAMSAAFIALVTAIVSIWQGALNRRYYRLSTKPHLVMQQMSSNGVPKKFILKNNGIGPAIIINFDVLVGGVPIDTKGCPVEKALSVIGASEVNCSIHTPTLGEALAISGELEILNIYEKQDEESIFETLKKLDCDVKFRIVYESIYGEQLTYVGNC